MQQNDFNDKWRNLLLLFILVGITLFTSCYEGYIGGDVPIEPALLFWASLLAGVLFGAWLAMTISTRRFAALIIVAFILEYIKEGLGIRVGLWKYANPDWLIGVWSWVLGTIGIYCIASKAAVRISSLSPITLPRFLNPIFVGLFFAVIVFLMPELPVLCKDHELPNHCQCMASSDGEIWVAPFWLFYVILMLVGVMASLWTDARVLFGVVASVLIVGCIGETAGSTARIWQYCQGGVPECAPPLHLLFGCLPLEQITIFALSALLAGEAFVELPPPGRTDGGPGSPVKEKDGGPGNEKAPPAPGKAAREQDAGTSPGDKIDPASMEPEHDKAKRPSGGGICRESNGHEEDAHGLTIEEERLATFLRLSALAYIVVGVIFAVAPVSVIELLDRIGSVIAPGAQPAPILGHELAPGSRFWVSMTFSMMMCIAFLAFYAQYGLRRNKRYVVPLLIAKFSSSFSSILYFVFIKNYFVIFSVFAVDGVLFWITLHFYIQANTGWIKRQTAYFRTKLKHVRPSGPTTVAVFKGEDKFDLLDRVLDETGFDKVLDTRFEEVNGKKGTTREEFSVVIKPNFMFMHAKQDFSTYTDPELVEHLVNRIAGKGYTNIAIVEARSTLGNYYANRNVVNVARVVGYSTDKNYTIVDLTEQMERWDYGGKLGVHWVGPAWRDADFRISFAKNKTHMFCSYTLTLKNVYGTLPLQNKFRHYHVAREYDWPAIETLKPRNFPVHFGLVDAFYSADGQFGVMADPAPNFTGKIFGGENLIAVDWVGCTMMGLDPEDVKVGRFYHLAVDALGRPEINWVGDKSPYEPWTNVSQLFIQALDIMEETYLMGNWFFCIASANAKEFPLTWTQPSVRFFRWLFKPFKAIIYKHDVL